MLLVVLLIIIMVIRKRQSRDLIAAQKFVLEDEKEKSEKLLLNTLPHPVASELWRYGSVKPRVYNMATVMFTDFKGFTKISEKMSAGELISELNFCFRKFDEIISQYKIEKIKTIGDGYMAAGGVPDANTTNPIEVVNAALDIRDFMDSYIQERIDAGKQYFEVRIGVNTGQVVAGVIGIKKFSYDLWGDTVNTASRMESAGKAGKVNISHSTYIHVKDHFECEHRGKIKAKHKGEIDMYFAERLPEEETSPGYRI